MERKGNDTNISFMPAAPDTIRVQSEQVKQHPLIYPLPGPLIKQEAADFNFEAEI